MTCEENSLFINNFCEVLPTSRIHSNGILGYSLRSYKQKWALEITYSLIQPVLLGAKEAYYCKVKDGLVSPDTSSRFQITQ